MHGRLVTAVAAVVVGSMALGVGARAKDKDKPVPQEANVHFARPEPRPTGARTPGTPTNSSTHSLLPDDVTILKGGAGTFVVNGGGHGLAIHRVSKDTTRADIAAQL